MGKQGPCTHCGIATTPLWRNGPPGKPVLCNACGSRWRTRGTLEGYMPLHAGGLGLGTSGGNKGKLKKAKPPLRAPKSKAGSCLGGPIDGIANRVGGGLNLKRKQPVIGQPHSSDETDEEDLEDEGFFQSFAGKTLPRGEYHRGYGDWEPSDEEGSNEGLHFGTKPFISGKSKIGRSASTGKLPTMAGSGALAFPVPSRKRSTTGRPRGGSQAANLSPSSSSFLSNGSRGFFSSDNAGSPEDYDEDDLMVHNMSPMVSVELGLGSLMVRTPSCDTLESYGGMGDFDFSYKEGGGMRAKGLSMHRVPSVSSLRLGEHRAMGEPKPNKALLENFPYSKRNVLSSSQSPMVFLDLKDIVNSDNFYLLLTAEERVGLLQMLPPLDTANGQNSVSEMFSSAEFGSAVLNFQQLLSEGVFDASETGHQKQAVELFQQLRSPSAVNLTEAGWWAKWDALHVKAKEQAKETAIKREAATVDDGSAGSAQYEEMTGQRKDVMTHAIGSSKEREGPAQKVEQTCSVDWDQKPAGLLEIGSSESDKSGDQEWKHSHMAVKIEAKPEGGLLCGEGFSGGAYSRSGSVAGLDSSSLENGYGGYREDRNLGSGYGLLAGDNSHMGEAASLFLGGSTAMPSLAALDGLPTCGGLRDDSETKLDSAGLLMNNSLSMFQDSMWDSLMWDSSCCGSQKVQPSSTALQPGPG